MVTRSPVSHVSAIELVNVGGEPVAPNLQLVEMGRDMPHAEGNINNLLMMSKTIDFQKTKVDPVTGTVVIRKDVDKVAAMTLDTHSTKTPVRSVGSESGSS